MTTTAKRAAAGSALAAAAALALTGCGGAPDDAEANNAAVTETQPEEQAEAVEGFPVGEPFEDAAWSVEVSLPDTGTTVKTRDRPVHVRGDRLIVEHEGVDGSSGVVAFSSDGEQVWAHEIPETATVGGVLEETVAVFEDSETEASGLDRAERITELTLLSLEDGSVVAEVELPDSAVGVTDYGEIVYTDDGLKTVTEDGELHEAEEPEEEAVGEALGGDRLVDPIPLDAAINPDDAFESEVRAIAKKQDVAVVQVGRGASPEWSTYAVDARSGEVIDELECSNAEHTDGDTNVGRNSPNGEYSVLEAYWISADEVRCFAGDDDTKGVEFTAVDDDGTAYGTSSEDELAVVTADGEAQVSDLPDGASAPIGIMDGGIAVHLRGSTITGNPIKQVTR